MVPDLTRTIMIACFFKSPAAVCLLAGALALSGCHHHKQVTSGSNPGPQAAASKDEASNQIPADLYKDMPMYPGATVTHVRKPKGAMREILMQVPGSPTLNQMVGFYKDGLKQSQFRITSALIMPARKTWSCDFHREGRPGSIMLYPDEKDKSVMVIDLIYEMPSHLDQALLEAEGRFRRNGAGQSRPGSQCKGEEELKWHYWMEKSR